MPGPLKNSRHERFVQALLQGESAVDAHEHAGYTRDDRNAARLRSNPKVVERLTELQTEVAKDTKISVESIVAELTDLAAKATNKSQFTAAIRAVVEKARIAGLLIERVEIGSPGSFEQCNSAGEIVDDLFKYNLNPYHAVTEQDREALIALFNRHAAETHAYIEAIKARPYVTANVNPPKRLTFGNGKAPSVT
jgi:hypothetical protein